MWNPGILLTGVIYGGIGGLLLGGLFIVTGRFERKRRDKFEKEIEKRASERNPENAPVATSASLGA